MVQRCKNTLYWVVRNSFAIRMRMVYYIQCELNSLRTVHICMEKARRIFEIS